MISSLFPRYRCAECHEIKDSFSEIEEHLMHHDRKVTIPRGTHSPVVPEQYRYVKKYIYILMNGESEITGVLVPSRPRNRIKA